MKWIRVDKSATAQPTSGTYRAWKALLRTEGKFQCVYCALQDARFGGMRNFHVEHYKPKGTFPTLKNDIFNLFYCCGICNSFKGDDWPADPANDYSNVSFPCPSKHDYSDFLLVDDTFRVTSEHTAGRYVLEKLFLNREQLILARRMDDVISEVAALLDRLEASKGEGLSETERTLLDVSKSLARAFYATPYEENDVRR